MHKTKLVTYQVMYGKDKRTPAIFLKSYDIDSLLDVVEYLVRACANKGLVVLPSHSTWEDGQREGLLVRSLLIQAYPKKDHKKNCFHRLRDEELEDLKYQVLHQVLAIFGVGVPGYYFNCNGVNKDVKKKMDAVIARLERGEVGGNSKPVLNPTLSRAESVNNALRALGINPKAEESLE